MKFLLYSDAHLDYCFFSDVNPFSFGLYQNHVRAIREEVGAKLTRSMLEDLMLHRFWDALSIINIKAKELGCDHIVNLGDTFGSSRFFDRKHFEQMLKESQKHPGLESSVARYKSSISRMNLFLYKHNRLIKEVLGDHILIAGNNDPFILPAELRNIFTYIDKPTVMFDKCLFMPMSWEEGGRQEGRNKNLSAQIANPSNIEIVFAHDCQDFNRFELSRSVQARKMFHGHSHKRKIPKRPNSRNVCVGGFFQYYTGFITYDDSCNEIKTYNAQGEEVNQADEVERYEAEQECEKEKSEAEKIRVLNSFTKRERKKIVKNTSENIIGMTRKNIIEDRKQSDCTANLTKEQLDELLERQIVLSYYAKAVKLSK